MKATITKAKAFYKKYERWFLPATLLIGFFFDVLTFKSLQIETTFIILAIYVCLAGASIIYLHWYDGKEEPPAAVFYKWFRLAAPIIASFSFGSLFSSSLLFYWFSGSLSASWPIIIFIAVLMTTSEVFKDFYLKESVQVGIYAFTLFAFFSILFPFLFTSLSSWTFLFGGFTSLFITLLFVFFLRKSSSTAEQKKVRLYTIVIVIFASMNALYFNNIIPPIPLAIRDAGVYDDLSKTADGYTLIGERERFPQNIIPGQKISAGEDKTLYAYTEIFAPAKLTTTIYHRWEYKDPKTKKWVTKSKPSFQMKGGRLPGYRGYTLKSKIEPGTWRISVETGRGQVLGRIPFTVVE
jgi:hypothetical protein